MVQPGRENLTLRELSSETERLAKELLEHLELGFVPKVRELKKLADRGLADPDDAGIGCVTVRKAVQRVLDSEAFTAELYEKLAGDLAGIEAAVSRIVEQG